MTPEEQNQYPAQMNYRPIKLSNMIRLPLTDKRRIMFKLISCVEHSGESAAGKENIA